MKRWTAMLAVGLGTAALSAGTAAAGCPEPGRDYPESKGYVRVDDTVPLPAGYACSGAVTLRIVGYSRTTVDGRPLVGDPRPGDVIKTEGPRTTVTVLRDGTRRSVKKSIDGTFYDRVRPNGKDFTSRGVGRNLYLGPGVEGLLWADGVQYFRAYTDPFRLEFTRIKGRTADLCAAVGLRPVAGRIVPETP